MIQVYRRVRNALMLENLMHWQRQQEDAKRQLLLRLQRSYSKLSTTSREARFMKKLMTGSSKVKKKWYTSEHTQSNTKALKEFNFFASSSKSVPSFGPNVDKPSTGLIAANSDETKKLPSGRVVRRVGVLNAVFLEHITSILSTGEIEGSESLFGLGLEITFVQVMPDFKVVNVYWYSSGSEVKEKFLESALKSIGFKLRHQLTQLRVIGIVPPIQFVKDDKYAKLMQIERLLEKADYGPDFVPTSGSKLLTSEPILSPSEISMNVVAKIEALAANEENTNEHNINSGEFIEEGTQVQDQEIEETINNMLLNSQQMRQDILGLDREKIMTGIVEVLSRSRKKKENLGQNESQSSISPEQLAIDIQNQSNRTELFLNYLKQQQLAQRQVEKRQSSRAFEKEFYDSLKRESTIQHKDSELINTENQFFNEQELDDYITDEEEDHKKHY